METDELKKLWNTLAENKLIEKDLAKENIRRIITLKSSKTVQNLSKKLKFDFWMNVSTALLVVAIAVFATLFLHHRGQGLPLGGYLFLALVITLFLLTALSLKASIRLTNLSFTNLTLLDSLQNVKNKFEKRSKKQTIISYIAMTILTVYANILLNTRTGFTNFNFNSLQGYVLIFSIIYLILMHWINKLIYKNRFAGIIDDLNTSINDLNSENK
jgi:hypothetical protein